MYKYQKWIEQNIPSCEGKIIVITGANSGIGYYASRLLASKGALVVMACRSLQRASDAKKRITDEFPFANIDIMEYDQASFDSIHHFASEIRKKYNKIDCLVLNAGIYHPREKGFTKDGFPLVMGVNYFGPFELIDSLDSYLSSLDSYRVIVVGSCVSDNPSKWYNFNFFKSNSGSKSMQYKASKMSLMKMAIYLGDRSSDNHKYVLMDPGATSSNIIQGFPLFIQKAGGLFMRIVFHSPEKASLGISYLAANDDVSNLDYYRPSGFMHMSGFPKKSKISRKTFKYVDDFYINTRRCIKDERD